MKKLFEENKSMTIFITVSFLVWRLGLFIPQFLGENFLIKKEIYLGPTAWANFDGGHYLKIAESGYGIYQEAFFPLFPAFINVVSSIFGISLLASALLIVHVSLFICLVLLWKIVTIDFSERIVKYTIVFFLLFPTSFFFVSVYTESLFFALILGAFYAARREQWLLAGLLGALASATRFVGIFIFPALIIEFFLKNRINLIRYNLKEVAKEVLGLFLIPLGLIAYMFYLNNKVGDSLAFIHAQSAFGANRTSGEIILLPQVIYRYMNIFLNLPLSNYNFWIALLEIVSFFSVFSILMFGFKKVRLSYTLFSLLAITLPTLTGTFSSMPRYVLAAFPIFIILAFTRSALLKVILLISFFLLQIILTVLFTRGYWVS